MRPRLTTSKKGVNTQILMQILEYQSILVLLGIAMENNDMCYHIWTSTILGPFRLGYFDRLGKIPRQGK